MLSCVAYDASVPRPTVPLSAISPMRGSFTYRDRDGVRWDGEVEYISLDGRLEPVGLTIRCYAEEGRTLETKGVARSLNPHWQPITSARMRAWAASTIDRQARGNLDRFHLDALEHDFPDSAHVAAIARAAREPGRARHSAEHWRTVADVYRHAFATSTSPAREVATRFKVKPSTARSWIRRCRELELLPPTQEREARA